MDWTLEVVVLPVREAPGAMKSLQLVVSDAAAARQELLDRAWPRTSGGRCR